MARRTGPALYELLGRRTDGITSGSSSRSSLTPSLTPPRGPALDANAEPINRPSMDPGQVRSLLLAAIVVIALIVAYLVGVSRGERVGRSSLVSESEADTQLLASSASNAAVIPPNASENQPRRNPPVQVQPEVTAAIEPASLPNALPATDAGVDPRTVGLNYFVLASTLEPNAVKIVEFCRNRGLDAWVVPDQNGRLREVTVMPGFEYSERGSPTVRELDERIRNVGVLFKASGPGNGDFGDRYHKLFKG